MLSLLLTKRFGYKSYIRDLIQSHDWTRHTIEIILHSSMGWMITTYAWPKLDTQK